MSPSATEALYHAIPQAPVAANPLLSEDVEDIDDDSPTHNLHDIHSDTKIHALHFMLGCAVLLPWNAIITATPYFLSRLASSPLQSSFSSYLSTSFTAANLAFLAHATAVSKQSPPSRQILVCLAGITILTALLAVSPFISLSPGLFFAFVILNGVAQAALGSYLQTSVIAVASLFGPSMVQSMMKGQAAVAVAVSAIQIVSSVISTWNESSSEDITSKGDPEGQAAFIFLGFSTIFLIVTAIAQQFAATSPLYRLVTSHLESPKTIAEDSSTNPLLSQAKVTGTDKENILRVAKANVTYEIAVALVFLVTLAVFPPITVSVQPVNPRIHALLFTSIHFLVFAIGDLAGRYICSYPRLLVWSARRLLSISLIRAIFIPLFLMCNVQQSPDSWLPSFPLLKSDFAFMLLLLLFGTSNGYVSSLCMMAAPSLEHNPRLQSKDDVDIAATVASFCLVGGLALGSIASFGVKATLCSCNPFVN